MPEQLPEPLVSDEEAGQTLAAVVRARGHAKTWAESKRLIDQGKVFVDGAVVTDPARRVFRGSRLELKRQAPRPPAPRPSGSLVYDDPQLVVIDKPCGVSSVPYEEREGGTAMDLVREHLRRKGRDAGEVALHIVHRIDKDTSGLIVFAKTKIAERALATAFREHTVERTYLCVVHGTLTDRRIETRLVEDRGDGLRGSSRNPKLGKRAITHVKVLEPLGEGATLCEVRLETGKTHQIRIHLSENGHPLVGERVYIRDYLKKELVPIVSPRLLLHAATLGFTHPLSQQPVRFQSALPEDFLAVMERLRKKA